MSRNPHALDGKGVSKKIYSFIQLLTGQEFYMTTNESDMPIVTDAVANAQENLSIDTTQALEMLTLLGYTDDEVVYARKLPRKVKPKQKGFKKDQRAEKFTFKLSSIPTTQTYDEAVYIVVNGQGQSKFVMDNDGKPTSQRLINHGRALSLTEHQKNLKRKF